jgi:hypothetical protein
MEGGMTYQPDLARLKRYFEDARDANDEQRVQSLIDRDYFDGMQWTPEERRVLQDRKQPDSVFNRVKPAVRGMVGVWEQGQNDPRAWPRNPQDEDAADVASKVLRFVKDYSEWASKRTACALSFFTEGTTAAIVQMDNEGRVDVEQIRFEEFFHDPRSRALDFLDARYMGVAKWMFADDVPRLYPDAKETITGALDNNASGLSVAGDTFSDRPDEQIGAWIDSKLRRVFVVEMYHQEGGEWMRCVFWGGGILEAGQSPYIGQNKKPCNPIKARSCYIDRDNRRYGEVRDMRGPQDEINKRRSKLLHLLNNRQAVAESDVALNVDAETVRREMSRPDGVIPPGWAPASLTDMTVGQFNLLGLATAEIERMGVNPAVLSQQSAGESGRAQLVRQQAGATDSAMAMNGLRLFELSIYRAMWERCKQFWTAPDWIRVTDDEKAAQFVGINQPIPGPPQVVMGEGGMPMIAPTVMGYQNQLAEMDVDITIDAVPDTANLAAEQFTALAEMARLYGPQEVPFDDLLTISAIPEKGKLLAKRKERAEQAQQGGEIGQQIQQRGAMASVAKIEAEAAYKAAQAQNEGLKPLFQGFQAGAA